jgi:hypothetical protein
MERARQSDILADPEGEGDKRQYIKITPIMEAQVLRVRQVLGVAATHAAVAEQVGLPERTVRYILTELPRLRRDEIGDAEVAKSLKERVYDWVREIGEIKDVGELRRLLGMADPEHDVVHVLHSLHTQGRIDFDERGNGQGTATYVNIRLPKKGSKSRPQSEPAAPPVEESVPAVPSQPEPSQPESVVAGYPLLDALRERETQRLAADAKAMGYLTAAEALAQIDPDESARLMKRIDDLAVTFPSPLEREYLRYAEEKS